MSCGVLLKRGFISLLIRIYKWPLDFDTCFLASLYNANYLHKYMRFFLVPCPYVRVSNWEMGQFCCSPKSQRNAEMLCLC